MNIFKKNILKGTTAIFFAVICHSAHSQEVTDSLLIDGDYRTFHFFQHSGETKGRNVVFVLHGSGGNGGQMMKPAERLEAMSDKEPVLLVYADGYKHYWNECRKHSTAEANTRNINEQDFFAGMLQYFAKHYQTNSQRFFVIGLSGGGHMAYKLAMSMPAKCRAICAVVANLPDRSNMDCTPAEKPVAVMIANGTIDGTNPYNGGEMIIDNHSWGNVRSTDASFRYWAQLDGYKGTPAMKQLPDPDPANGQTITQYTFSSKGKPEVTLLKVNGGEHAFPKDVDVFVEAWRFFEREMEREK